MMDKVVSELELMKISCFYSRTPLPSCDIPIEEERLDDDLSERLGRDFGQLMRNAAGLHSQEFFRVPIPREFLLQNGS